MRKSLLQFWFSILAENWGDNAKLIYKYQILYLDHIGLTIVPWRHFVNDIDLCHRLKSPKNSINPLYWRSRSLNSTLIESQCMTSY